jgi:drug/metabolite transporter (DMT)-like permease
MARIPRSAWLNVAAAVLGGIMLGFGIGRFAHHPSPVPGVMAVVGLVVLWYAVSDRRKAAPENPESETHGHTVE